MAKWEIPYRTINLVRVVKRKIWFPESCTLPLPPKQWVQITDDVSVHTDDPSYVYLPIIESILGRYGKDWDWIFEDIKSANSQPFNNLRVFTRRRNKSKLTFLRLKLCHLIK